MKTILIYIAFIFFCLTGCDKSHDILINGTSINKEIVTECGKINIEVSTFNGQYFFVKQEYDLNKEIKVYPDSLIIDFKGSHLPFTIIGSEKIEDESEIILSGKGYIKIDFEVNQTAHKGDTIKIHSQGYIYCQNKILPLDTLNLIIDKEFN